MSADISSDAAEKSLRFAGIATVLLALFLGFVAAIIPLLFLALTMFTGGSESTMQMQFVIGAAVVFVLVVASRIVLSRGRALFRANRFREARQSARIATGILALPAGVLVLLYVLVRVASL